MLVEFIYRRAISTASLKRVCEKAETREPAQEGDFAMSEQMF
jgi:hypothetical protein